jgi:glycosyltransferase involved in cell wall biosynthesis
LHIPVVVEFNGLLNLEAGVSKFLLPFGHIRHFNGLLAAVTLSLERLVARRSKGVVCVSPTIRDQLVRRHNLVVRTQVIENGVDCEVFVPGSRTEVRKRLGLDLNAYMMVYVGSLVAWQGLDVLVEASKLVVLERAQSVFLLVGDGPLRQPLLERVRSLGLENHFIFTGEVAHREIPRYISAADICLAPFKRARNLMVGLSPLKVVEYMACGRAVVTTKIPGVSELVVGSGAGLAVLPDDPRELARAILHLLEDPACRETCERNARLAALELDWNSRARQLLDFLQLVASSGART